MILTTNQLISDVLKQLITFFFIFFAVFNFGNAIFTNITKTLRNLTTRQTKMPDFILCTRT